MFVRPRLLRPICSRWSRPVVMYSIPLAKTQSLMCRWSPLSSWRYYWLSSLAFFWKAVAKNDQRPFRFLPVLELRQRPRPTLRQLTERRKQPNWTKTNTSRSRKFQTPKNSHPASSNNAISTTHCLQTPPVILYPGRQDAVQLIRPP